MKNTPHYSNLLLFVLVTFLLFFAASCFALPSQTALPPEPSETPAPTGTATIQWFPSTHTPTFLPTRAITPTPEQNPGVGAVILKDDFTDTTLWNTRQTEEGSVAFSKQKLTLAISQPQEALFSFRTTGAWNDFYLTLRANPVLCRQADRYAVLFRVQSSENFYRLLVNCDGYMRLEVIRNSKITILQDWISSGEIPPGSPISLEIGIWAAGSDLRVFVNDVYQFGAIDGTFLQGGVGVYAKSMGTNAVTINFSDLIVHAVNP